MNIGDEVFEEMEFFEEKDYDQHTGRNIEYYTGEDEDFEDDGIVTEEE